MLHRRIRGQISQIFLNMKQLNVMLQLICNQYMGQLG
jgi:hypothetical protein